MCIIKIQCSIVIIVSLFSVSAVGSFEASVLDTRGLNDFISEHQKAIEQKDILWMVKNDPRHIALAEWSKKSQKEMISNLVKNYPKEVFSFSHDINKIVCSININQLIVSIVEYQVTYEGKSNPSLIVYIKDNGRWWYTGNSDARVGLYPFREKMLGNIDNKADLHKHQQALSNNKCMSKVKF